MVPVVPTNAMLWFLTTVPFYAVADASACKAGAFALPICDVLIDPTIEDSYIIGLPASLGTPEQQVVFLPWPELNNTYVYDENAFCDETVIFGDTVCRIRRGGLYLESNSATWQQKVDLVDAGGARLETNNPDAEAGIKDLVSTSLGGTDSINIGSSGVIVDFPVGIPRLQWDNGYSTLHPLGMGPNSTYLNALYHAGVIGARVWSLFWGRMWTKHNPLNGSLVIGGYDEKLAMGQNYTKPLDYSGNCFTGLKVNVLTITLNPRGGGEMPLLDVETPACIVPTRQNLLGLETSYQTAFQYLTGIETIGDSFGIHWGSMLFDADRVYDGDITIALSTGLSVRVQNDQFVTPFVYYERNGSRLFNESQKEVLISGLREQTVTLGRYFLTASYLMVNYEEGTFTMWNANPTNTSSLRSLSRTTSSNLCSNSTIDTGTSEANPHTSKVGMSAGALAGTIVAVVAASSIAALLLYHFFRRKTRQHTEPVAVTQSNGKNDSPHELHHSFVQSETSELQGTQLSLLSLNEGHGASNAVHEMAESSRMTISPAVDSASGRCTE